VAARGQPVLLYMCPHTAIYASACYICSGGAGLPSGGGVDSWQRVWLDQLPQGSALTISIAPARSLPLLVRKYKLNLYIYLKVQRWWHQCILFCTPKWEAFEKWAKDAKVPYFARRVLSNAVFHRISYLCCSRMLTDADGC